MPLERIPFEERPLAQAPQGTDLPLPDNTGFSEAFGAGFELESDVANVAAYLQRDKFEPDPKFNPITFGEGRPLFTEYADQLAVTNSEDEYLAMEMRIKEQKANMELLASRPVTGFLGAAAGAVLSPVSLVPLTGQARGARGVGQAFALAAGAAGAQEATLFGLQETRTMNDLALGVTFGTVLGGMLGGIAVGMRGVELDRLARTVEGKEARGELVIQRYTEDGAREDVVVRTVNPTREDVVDELRELLQEYSEGLDGGDTVELARLRAIGVETTEQVQERLARLSEVSDDELAAFLRAAKASDEELEANIAQIRNSQAANAQDFIEASQAFASFTRSVSDAQVIQRTLSDTLEDVEGPINRFRERRLNEERADLESALEENLGKLFPDKYEIAALADELVSFYKLPETAAAAVRKLMSAPESVSLFERSLREGASAEEALARVVTNATEEIVVPARQLALIEDQRAFYKEINDEVEARVEALRNPQVEPLAEPRPGQASSIGAAAPRNVPRSLTALPGTRTLVDTLAKLNPLTRLLNGRFAAGRYHAARLQNPNISLDYGDPLGPARSASEDGTIQARSLIHQAPVVEFLLAHDRAYANHLAGKDIGDSFGQTTLAKVKGLTNVPEGKMTYKEFGEAVYDASNTGEKHYDDFVNESAKAQRELYDYFLRVHDDYFAERQFIDGEDAQPLFVPFEGDATGAKEYARHIPDAGKIIDMQDEFLADVEEHILRMENEAFAASYARYARAQAKNAQMQRLLEMPENEAKELFDRAQANIDSIEAEPTWQRGKQQLTELRKQLRASGADDATIRAESKAMEESLGPEFADLEKQRKGLVADRRVLTEIGATATEEQRKLLEQVAKLERVQENQLDVVINAALRAQQKLGRVSDKKLDAEFDKLRQRLKREISIYNKHANAVESAEAKDDFVRADAREELVQKADARIKEVFKRISDAEGMDRTTLRADIQEAVNLAKEKAVRLNGKRAVRAERLREKAEAISPEEKAAFRAKELEKVKTRQTELQQTFTEKWRARGGFATDELEITEGGADFSAQAQADALEILNRLTGNESRVAGLDILGQKRGPQLARAWNLPYETKKKYLIRNPEFVSRSYAHTMGPDLELYRATGSPNGARMFDELNAEIKAEREQVSARSYATQAAKEKALRVFDKDAKRARDDLRGLVERLRHQRGMPQNAEGFMYRAGRAARNANTFRFMGTVAVSSLPDVARPVFRFGMQSTFKNAWTPYVTDLARVKMTREQAYRFGIATDPMLHNRANQVFDAGENVQIGRVKAPTAAGRGVQNAEKALEVLANRTGQVALFDRWTAEMKHHTFGVTIAEVSHGLRVLAEGGGSAKELARAQQMFADMSIGPNMQRRIWEQYKLEGGSDEFDGGFRLPNTDKWTDQEAVRALAAGVNNIVDDLIITPALDRPLWMDQNEAFRIVAQFRSFTFTATTRIMLASLQRPDAAALWGIIVSVGLGAMSHAMWSLTSGRWDEYEKESAERKIYEAVERSGITGVLSEATRIGEQIPGLNDYAVFGGSGSRTRRANSVLGAALGPSYDLAERVVNIVQGMDEPTQSTLHTARTLAPYQNVFWLRTTLDKVEESLAEGLGLPERRGD